MMMKRRYLILPSLLFQSLVLMSQENPDQFPEAGVREENHLMRVTARVIDEEGNPMAGVPVRIGIHNVNDFRDQYNDFHGKTNEVGKFSAEGIGRGLAKIDVQKEGYYLSRKTVTCYEGNEQQIRELGRYAPWNPTIDIMIKKIGKPIPMRVWLGDRGHMAPKVGAEVGFDLYVKDWVQPHGKGEHPDLLVKFSTLFIDQNDYSTTCSIRFANPYDGFIPIPELLNTESLLKYPRIAPDEGYELKRLLITRGPTGNEARSRAVNKEPIGYLLRFRSIKDGKTPKIISAYYGKITRPQERVGNVNPFEVHSLDRVN